MRAAFGVRADAELTPLAGALEQTAWRAGDVVLKPVQEANPGEADWVAGVLDAIEENGFRVIKPVRSVEGTWLEHGWTAWCWFDGHHERARWHDVVAATDAFHAAVPKAIAQAGVAPRPDWLDRRGHRWARAEATVWHGERLPPTVNHGAVEWRLYERATAVGPPLTDDARATSIVVHGDIASNVLRLADASTHAFIDMSPGWRPAASTRAQIAVEAVTWFGAPVDLLEEFPREDIARASAFRLLCGLQASPDWAADFPGEIEAWTRAIEAIGA